MLNRRLTEMCSSGGCAAKYDAPLLAALLEAIPTTQRANVLVGLDPPDDAAVMAIGPESALVFTVDFFPPLVDDPDAYGRIAANNALNDVYAMGADPALALAIAAFPTDLDPDVVGAILRGAAAQCDEAGVSLAGGHTIRDDEPKFGLAVAGFVNPDRIWQKSGARPGDVLCLTKPLGTGILVTAKRRGLITDEDLASGIAWMLRSNREAAAILGRRRPHAVTDVTGFGLLGHALEMSRASQVQIVLRLDDLPLISPVKESAAQGVRTSGHGSNLRLVDEMVSRDEQVDETLLAIALDPQTAGGLMVAVAPEDVDEIRAEFDRAGLFLSRIGSVSDGEGVRLL